MCVKNSPEPKQKYETNPDILFIDQICEINTCIIVGILKKFLKYETSALLPKITLKWQFKNVEMLS